MNRRDFLRLIGVAPIAPSVLFLEQNTQEKCSLAIIKKAVRERIDIEHRIFAVEDIPKGEYGWAWCGGVYPRNILVFKEG